MKKLDAFQKLRQMRLSNWAMHRLRTSNQNRPHYAKKLGRNIKLERILAPHQFDLTRGSGKLVIDFLRQVAQRVLDEKHHAQLDFRHVTSFRVPGALLLFAELRRIITQSDFKKAVTIHPPRSERARQVMQQIGLFELTGDKYSFQTNRDDVIYWRLNEGATQSGDEIQMLESIADKVNQRYKDSLEVSKVWKGVSEAVNNAQEHAYSKPRQDGFEGMRDCKWWLLTQLRNERFTAAVCDLGCGYSETLKPEMWEGFLNSAARVINSGNKHTDAIEAAMEYGRSRTRLSERGRGSRDALTLLERHENGELFILSHGGYVLYKRLEGVTSKPKSFKLDFEVPGTIIWWNLPLEGKNENKH